MSGIDGLPLARPEDLSAAKRGQMQRASSVRTDGSSGKVDGILLGKVDEVALRDDDPLVTLMRDRPGRMMVLFAAETFAEGPIEESDADLFGPDGALLTALIAGKAPGSTSDGGDGLLLAPGLGPPGRDSVMLVDGADGATAGAGAGQRVALVLAGRGNGAGDFVRTGWLDKFSSSLFTTGQARKVRLFNVDAEELSGLRVAVAAAMHEARTDIGWLVALMGSRGDKVARSLDGQTTRQIGDALDRLATALGARIAEEIDLPPADGRTVLAIHGFRLKLQDDRLQVGVQAVSISVAAQPERMPTEGSFRWGSGIGVAWGPAGDHTAPPAVIVAKRSDDELNFDIRVPLPRSMGRGVDLRA